jgi:protein-S-isoprenylcysteine O-methyltransferase Ste14
VSPIVVILISIAALVALVLVSELWRLREEQRRLIAAISRAYEDVVRRRGDGP